MRSFGLEVRTPESKETQVLLLSGCLTSGKSLPFSDTSLSEK